jgi:hypothetical protein
METGATHRHAPTARAPKLRQAVRDAKRAGHAYVIVDGTLIPVDRLACDKPFYSGKHKQHGMNLQVIASPDGGILRVSGALPGSVHDKKAEWIWDVLGEPGRQGLVILADKGYQGSTWAKVPYKGRNKPEPQKEANRAHAKLRAPGERANAQFKIQDLEDPVQAPLLPLARRETRQGHPRTAAPRCLTKLKRLIVTTRKKWIALSPDELFPSVRRPTAPGNRRQLVRQSWLLSASGVLLSDSAGLVTSRVGVILSCGGAG